MSVPLPVSQTDDGELLSQVELVPLSRIVPDRYQARLALPPNIRNKFFSGAIDCYQAARLILQAAEKDPALHGIVNDLGLLGDSIVTDGQIDPATGTWFDHDGEAVFILETGERRFWSLALQAIIRSMETEPCLKVIPNVGPSRQRQVVENFLRKDLCAVEIGRAVATMILESLDVYPEEGEDELHYCRRIFSILRLPKGTWPEIERVTGMSHVALYRYLILLKLDDELLYIATLNRLAEGALRPIVQAPREERPRMVEDILDARQSRSERGRTSKDRDELYFPPSAQERIAARMLSLLKALARQEQVDGSMTGVADEVCKLAEDLPAMIGVLERVTRSMKSLAPKR